MDKCVIGFWFDWKWKFFFSQTPPDTRTSTQASWCLEATSTNFVVHLNIFTFSLAASYNHVDIRLVFETKEQKYSFTFFEMPSNSFGLACIVGCTLDSIFFCSHLSTDSKSLFLRYQSEHSLYKFVVSCIIHIIIIPKQQTRNIS